MDNSKRGHIPMQERLELIQIKGSIMYAVRCTRPDVAFAVKILTKDGFQQNPVVNFTGLLCGLGQEAPMKSTTAMSANRNLIYIDRSEEESCHGYSVHYADETGSSERRQDISKG
ncbi:hypothetical protein Tco_0324861 [Tanacetum coccineum]